MCFDRLLVIVIVLAACDSAGTKPSDAGAADAARQCSALIADYHRYVTEHQTCSKDEDCTAGYGCDCNFGWAAVNIRSGAEAEAQRADIVRRCGCPGAVDGPIYAAACVSGRCTLGPGGGSCGFAVNNDTSCYEGVVKRAPDDQCWAPGQQHDCSGGVSPTPTTFCSADGTKCCRRPNACGPCGWIDCSQQPCTDDGGCAELPPSCPNSQADLQARIGTRAPECDAILPVSCTGG